MNDETTPVASAEAAHEEREAPAAPESLEPTTSATPGPERTGLPDWAPGVTLAALLGFGLLGGLGIIPVSLPKSKAAALAAAPQTSSSAAAGPSSERTGPKIRVSHIVVTHRDTAMGQHQHVTRTKEEARARAAEALRRAHQGEDFGKLAVEFSDAPEAKETKGDLGRFRTKDAVPQFSAVAFRLKVGELSDVVETPFGYHVILRTE